MGQSCIRAICFFSLLLFFAVGTAFSQKLATAKLPNGFYFVLSERSSREVARTDSVPNIVLLYDGKYVDSSQATSPSYVALDTTSFVPLIIGSVISEGKVQITRCYDNAWEVLFSKLTK